MVTTTGILAILAAPALVLLLRARLQVLVPTVLVTWLVTTFALSYLLPDPSDLTAFYFYFLLIVPGLGIPLATMLATRFAKSRGHLVSVAIMAALGWVAGLVVGFLIDMYFARTGLPYYFWAYAAGLAAPVSYAGSAAAWAASTRS